MPETVRPTQGSLLHRQDVFEYPPPQIVMPITPEVARDHNPIVEEFLRFYKNTGIQTSELLSNFQGYSASHPVSLRTYEMLNTLKTGAPQVTTHAVNSIGLDWRAIQLFQLNQVLLSYIDKVIQENQNGQVREMTQKTTGDRERELSDLGGYLSSKGMDVAFLRSLFQNSLGMTGASRESVDQTFKDLFHSINDLLLSRPLEDLQEIREQGNVFETLQQFCFELSEFRKIEGAILPEMWRFNQEESKSFPTEDILLLLSAKEKVRDGKTLTADELEYVQRFFSKSSHGYAAQIFSETQVRYDQKMEDIEALYRQRTLQFEELTQAIKNIDALNEVLPEDYLINKLKGLPQPAPMIKADLNDPANMASINYQDSIENAISEVARKLNQLMPKIDLRIDTKPKDQVLEVDRKNPPLLVNEELFTKDREKRYRKTFEHRQMIDEETGTVTEAFIDKNTGEWHVGEKLTLERIMRALKEMDYTGKGPIRQFVQRLKQQVGLSDGLEAGQVYKKPLAEGNSTAMQGLTTGMAPLPQLGAGRTSTNSPSYPALPERAGQAQPAPDDEA